MVHRIVAKYFVDGWFDGAVVNHIDGNKHNNNYENLEWITQKDNIIDQNKRNNQTPTKWYKQWKIIYPNGTESDVLNGGNEIKKYISDNNLPCIYSQLRRYGSSKNYKLVMVDKCVTTIPKGSR